MFKLLNFSNSCRAITTILLLKSNITKLIIIPLSDLIVSGGCDRVVRFWNRSTGERKGSVEVAAQVNCLSESMGKKVSWIEVFKRRNLFFEISGCSLLTAVAQSLLWI